MWASITVGHWTPQQPSSLPSHSSLAGFWIYISRIEWNQWDLQASRINSPNQTPYNRQLFSLEVRHQNEAQNSSFIISILLETHINILRLFLWVWTPNFFLILNKKQRNKPTVAALGRPHTWLSLFESSWMKKSWSLFTLDKHFSTHKAEMWDILMSFPAKNFVKS